MHWAASFKKWSTWSVEHNLRKIKFHILIEVIYYTCNRLVRQYFWTIQSPGRVDLRQPTGRRSKHIMKCIINRIIFLTRTAWFKNQVAFLIRKVYFFNGAGKSILSRNTSATAGYTCEMQAANESSSSWLSCLPPQGRCLPSSRRLPPCWRWQDPSVRSLRWFPSPVACHSPLWIEFYRPSLLLCITSCKLFFF